MALDRGVADFSGSHMENSSIQFADLIITLSQLQREMWYLNCCNLSRWPYISSVIFPNYIEINSVLQLLQK